ncbi:spermatogenesis-associated protein 17 [Aplochiton taeniatus]
MAKFVKLQSEIEGIKKEYFSRNRLVEQSRLKEHEAAVEIQSWFRGCQVRAYLRHLHRKATVIERAWRGMAGRARSRQMAQKVYFIMKMNFYNKMAVKIQQRWKGYYVRKYVHNYHARKRYLEGLVRMNEEVRRDLDELAEGQRQQRERLALEREEQDKTMQALKKHHLLSTQQCPGVFNSPFRTTPHEMELRLQRARPQPSRAFRRNGAPPLGASGSTAPCPPGAAWACGGLTSQPLPPIPSKKPQGPFRDPVEVWHQRQRDLEPSLRVQTSFSHQEEAREELPYERMMHSMSPSRPQAYGTKHFREEKRDRLVEREPFKTVFTTCHVFDRFGRLYSNAGKIV